MKNRPAHPSAESARPNRESSILNPQCLACLLLLSAFCLHAQAYSIGWYKIANGGGSSANTNFSVTGTLGQAEASAPMTDGDYTLTGGFWGDARLVQWPASPVQFVLNNGVATITGDYSTNCLLILPPSLQGHPVTGIAASAFYDNTNLVGVTIPDPVMTIGANAFAGCSQLVSVGFGSNVAVIQDGAFNRCLSLRSVILPDSVTAIGSDAFSGSGLTNIALGSKVVSLGNNTFAPCPQLLSITVSADNPVLSSLGGVLFDKNQVTLLTCPGGLLGVYTLPGSVTSIGNYAFNGCDKLTGVILPDDLTSIGVAAFNACTHLTSLAIPDSVTSLGDFALYSCTSLTHVTVGSGISSLGSYQLSSCPRLMSVYFTGNAPPADPTALQNVSAATIYYLPGKTGWGSPFFNGIRTAPWLPTICNSGDLVAGLPNHPFGFALTWAPNTTVVVEVSTNLAAACWSPVATNVLTSGSATFSDPQWANSPGRFYRVRSL